MCKIKLEEYEELCPECNGSGSPEEIIEDQMMYRTCCYCGGTGKTDWLQKINKKDKLNRDIMNFTLVFKPICPIEKIETRFTINTNWNVEFGHGK